LAESSHTQGRSKAVLKKRTKGAAASPGCLESIEEIRRAGNFFTQGGQREKILQLQVFD